MALPALPPLTGSALFDLWRIRYREQLLNGLPPGASRRPTRSELLLWEQLRHSPREWVAEFPTRYGYRLDFYCPEVRLAVEVDGPSHWGELKRERDAWRDTVHERMGIRTRRFSAAHVEADAGWVAREIEACAADRARTSVDDPAEVADEVAAVDDLADDERLRVLPPEQPGWSEYLPACRTVLPVFPERPALLQQVASLRR